MEEANLISLTPTARAKVGHLIQEDKRGALKFRIYIIGGGCSGFQYGFALTDESQAPDDYLVGSEPAVLIDALSAQYLKGAEIDYIENLQGARFVVNNPNAQTTCGCGSSFSINSD